MEEEITYHTCSKCGEEKPLTSEYFYRCKKVKSGFATYCKLCEKKRIKLYREENPEKISKVRKEQYRRNKKDLNWVEKEKIDSRKRNKKYRTNNREKMLERCKKYREENYEEIYNRLKNDPLRKLRSNISSLIRRCVNNKGWSKNTKTHNYLKCDYQTFKEHLESQFTEGMSWDNQGEWHYDHIYPVSLAQTEEDMFIFNHYTNFQPLWAKDNLSKSNKVPDGFEEWYESMKEKVPQ